MSRLAIYIKGFIKIWFSTTEPYIASHNYLSIKITDISNLIYLLDNNPMDL